jgi:Kef-type K+ transport system membrane component KefB
MATSDDARPAEAGAAGTASGFGRGMGAKAPALYALVSLLAFGVLYVVLHAGTRLHAPADAGSKPSTGEAIDVHAVLWRLLLAIAVVVIAARVVGALFRRIGQPQVMGEIVAGIILGPSVLGAVWSGSQQHLFNAQVLPFLDVLAQVGLIFFMFLIGVELDVRLIRGRGQAAALVSHVSIVLPFVSGIALAYAIFTRLGSPTGRFTPFALFLGASMSITAFPVLARILTERGLHRTRLGTVTITCAAVDDVTAWCMLAVVVAIASAHGVGSAVLTIALAAAFITFMIAVVRPIVGGLERYFDDHERLSGSMLALLLVGLLLSALATDRIGIHAIFGAFLFGAIMPHHSTFISEITNKLEDFAVVFLLPLFFAFSGLRTEIGQLGADPGLWLICALITLVAIGGKWGGSTIAARVVGLSWRESLGLGILMNCRGLTELVILNIGLDLGVIPPTLFAMLVIMALVTTFMTTPILGAIYPRDVQARMIEEEGGDDADGVVRILVHIPNIDVAYELVHSALAMVDHDGDAETQVLLVRTLQISDNVFRAGSLRATSRAEQAAHAMRPIVDFVEGAGCTAVPLVMQTTSPAETIVRLTEERKPSLVLLHMSRPALGRRLLATGIGRILREAAADVVVSVDPRRRGMSPRRGGEVHVPYGGGCHEEVARDLAVRIAGSSGAHVRLVADSQVDRAHDLAVAAADAYEQAGVWATADVTEGDVAEHLLAAARDADLVVLGLGDTWADDQGSFGPVRELLAARVSTPMLLVRRAGQQQRRGARRWFTRRAGEWMQDSTGEIDLREGAGDPAALGGHR